MREFLLPIYQFMDPIFLGYFSAINLIYGVLLLFGTMKVYKRMKEVRRENSAVIVRSESLPEIAFILPLYNEKESVILAVDSLLNLTYRHKRLIIVNDGSKDNTLELLRKHLSLVPMDLPKKGDLPSKPIRGTFLSTTHPNVVVIDKENGTKYDALNAGLNFCQSNYFITIDADTVIDDKSFEAIIRPLLESPDAIAIGACVRIRNGCSVQYNSVSTEGFPKSYLAAMQSFEYLRSFLMRQGWDYLGGNHCVSGAFACFQREAVVKAGGFGPTFANDLEIIVRLQRLNKANQTGFRIAYLPDPVAWTNGPDTLKALAKQRMVWHRGLLETLWFHKPVFFNPKYGAFGLFVYPFLVFGEAIEPLVEILGYIYIIVGLIFGIVNISYFFLFVAVTMGLTFVFTLFCLLIEELSFKKYVSFRSLVLLFAYNLFENIGYRQLTLFWRAQGFGSFFRRFRAIKEANQYVKELVKKNT